MGSGGTTWTHWQADVQGVMKYDRGVYGEKPLHHLGMRRLFLGHAIRPKLQTWRRGMHTLAYAAKPTSWENPNGIGFAGNIGLAASLDPARGAHYAKRLYGKRILEIARFNDHIQGFAPWFQKYDLDAATLWNQPTFCGMLGEFGAPPTSYFSSREYQQPYFIVNSRNTAWKNLTLHVNLLSSDGKGQKLVDYRIPSLAAWEKKEGTVALTFPGNLRPGKLSDAGSCSRVARRKSAAISTMSFVQDQSVTTKKISTKGRIAMLAPGTEQIGDIRKVFSDLGIKKDELTDLSLLSNYDVLVVPPAKSPSSAPCDQAEP